MTTLNASETIYRPGEPVPYSGIYDVVDGRGRYLNYQRAVTQNAADSERFPELDDGAAVGYVIRQAPINLVQQQHIYPPGAEVPCDGIYDVVDYRGEWVGRQKVCRAGTRFPPTQHTTNPNAFGYALHVRAIDRER